jgi:Tol biopolymer transport system component
MFPNDTGQPGTWDPNGQNFVTQEILIAETGEANSSALEPIASSRLMRFNRLEEKTQNLTIAENLEDASPAYSPDGSFLAFARRFLEARRWTPGKQLWLMTTDGREARQLTNDPFYNHFDFAWRPDSDQLAFVRFNQTVMTEPPELWLINQDGSGATKIVEGGYDPQWIP